MRVGQVFLAVLFTTTAIASPALGVHRQGHACVHCPRCHTCCNLEVSQEKETKHCWKIECKEICVPCVVFPWQKRAACAQCGGLGCPSTGGVGSSGHCVVHNGARVITVCEPVKEEYECPTCSYTWTAGRTSSGTRTFQSVHARESEVEAPYPRMGSDGSFKSEQAPKSPFLDDPIRGVPQRNDAAPAVRQRSHESSRWRRLMRIHELIQGDGGPTRAKNVDAQGMVQAVVYKAE